MGWFGSSSASSGNPQKLSDGGFVAPDRSNRAKCWGARDHFFECLDRHDILDSVAEDKLAKAKCGAELAEFENACVSTWVEYFKKRRVAEFQKAEQLAKLEKQGAQKLPGT